MPLATIVLTDHDTTNNTFTLIGNNTAGGEYRVVSRPLAKPLSLQFNFKIGPASSKANDKLVVSIRDVGINTDTGVTYINQIRTEASISRDTQSPATAAEDLMALLASLLSDADFRSEIADGILPSSAQS